MSDKYGPESTCYDVASPNPEPAPELRDPNEGNAEKSGFTVMRRRPRTSPPGEWTDPEQADRMDEFSNQVFGSYPADDY